MNQKFAYRDRLLLELSNNSRMKRKEISKKLRISPQLISYAIDKMSHEKTILNYQVRIDPAKFGLLNVMVFMVYTTFEKEQQKKIKDYLLETAYVTYIDETSHKADLIVEYTVPNLSFFNKTHAQFLHQFNNDIKVIEIYPVIVKHFFPQRFLNKRSKFSSDIILSGDRERIDLSESSRSILSELIKNPQIGIVDIAKKTGLNVRTVTKKIKLLEENQIIRGYGITLNYAQLGISVGSILVKMYNPVPTVMKKMVTFCETLHEVTSLTKLLGVYDLLIRIESFKSYSETLNQLRAEFRFYEYTVCDSSNILKNTYVPESEVLQENRKNKQNIYI